MLSLFRFVLGYVKIYIVSTNPECFFNLLIEHGISIWAVERHKEYIECCIPFKDYKNIRKLRNRLDVKPRVKLIEKRGLSVSFKKVFKRKSIVYGVLLAATINVFLSNFIWIIDVNGLKQLNRNLVISVINNYGIDLGYNRRKIDSYDLSQKIALDFDEIAWVSVNVEGSKLSINVSESVDSNYNTEPSHLIASVDGVIKEIKTTQGENLVKVGQTVRKGDLLVSGIETIGESVRYSCASGEIIADTNRVIMEKIPKNYMVRKQCDSFENKAVFEFFNIKIPLFLTAASYNQLSFFEDNKISIFDKKLPIGISKRTFVKSENICVDLTLKEAQNLAISRVEAKLREKSIININNYKVKYKEDTHSYIFTIDLNCTENIAKIYNIDI